MKIEQFDIHRIMMVCDVCRLFGCVKDDVCVHSPGIAEQRVFCCVGCPFRVVVHVDFVKIVQFRVNLIT